MFLGRRQEEFHPSFGFWEYLLYPCSSSFDTRRYCSLELRGHAGDALAGRFLGHVEEEERVGRKANGEGADGLDILVILEDTRVR